jgi:hypothetical protein
MGMVPKILGDVRYGSLAEIRERIRDVRFIVRSRHAHRRQQCLLSAKSGDLPVRLLAINGERKLAACSLLEGQWPTRAVDASWPRF